MIIETENQLKASLDRAAANRKLKMDWLGLENTLRDILRLHKNKIISGENTIYYIDEAIETYTGRRGEL